MAAFEKFPVFIDVGASDGRIWTTWLNAAPDAHIYAFEPDPTNFKTMSDQYSSGRPNVTMLQTAVSTVDSPAIPFYISNDRNSSSVYPYSNENVRKWRYPPGRRLFKTMEIIQVPAMRLDTLIKKEHIRYVDFLKIDAQGHELEILKSLGASITKVREIVVEASLTPFDIYVGQTNQMDKIVDFMTENGFKLHKQEKISRNQEINLWFINTRFSKIQRNKFYHFPM